MAIRTRLLRVYIVITSLILFVLHSHSTAAVGDWKTYKNADNICDLVSAGVFLWCASTGGVLRVDVITAQIEQLTTTEGISSNDVSTVAVDENKDVWIGTKDGDLNYLHHEGARWITFNDYKGHALNDLQIVGDSIFVAFDIGVSLFIIDRQNVEKSYVKESYKKLGSALAWDTKAVDILIADRDVWVATPGGLARSSLAVPNLMDPQFWENYSTSDGIPSDNILCLEMQDGVIYVGTDNGLIAWDGTQWLDVGLGNRQITALWASGDSLLAATSWGVYVRRQDGYWHGFPSLSQILLSICVDSTGTIWVGTNKGGLFYYQAGDNSWSNARANCPGADAFSAMVIDLNGHLWCTSAGDGVSALIDGSWLNLTRDNGLNSSSYRTVVVDRDNRKWCGSTGYGITIITEVGDSLQFAFIDTTGGRLSGSDTPAYVIVNSMKVDNAGNIWILNKYAANSKPVAVVSPEGEWGYFTIGDGIPEKVVTCIEIDSRGWKWIGMENRGIVVIDDGGTPFIKSDDAIRFYLTMDDGLNSNTVRSIAADEDEVVWIGTNAGLNYWYNGEVGSRGGLLSYDINIVAIDFRNNKWIGTKSGVSVLSFDSYSWTHYSTDNSLLVGGNVQSFAFDPLTGYAFIGTESGLSRLETPYTPPRADLSEVVGYPNPFILDSGGTKYIVKNLADGSEVRFFTLEGLLVKTILKEEIPGSWAEWDGRNSAGDYVASGVYVYVIYTEDNHSYVGKVAVIKNK